MIKMERISKTYEAGNIETRALRDLGLTIETGDFVSITGPSGSGKTTFLNIAGLLESFSGGRYELDGVDVSHLNDRARSKVRNEKIGFIFQDYNLIPDLDVYSNIDAPLWYRSMKRPERRERIQKALKLVGLSTRAKHVPGQLSGGQQQRVAIARAIAGSPRLILADEPTGNLDSEMSREIMNLITEINEQGTTVVMVTHDPDHASLARRNIHLMDGRFVNSEPVATDAGRQAPAQAL